MRIACVHLPAFTLQVEVRRAPHLAGRAVAVASGGERPAVVACSRAAHALGVRPALSVAQARAIAPALEVIAADARAHRAALTALAEVLMAHSVTVDLGDDGEPAGALATHRALYLHVPPSARGARFAAELAAELGRQGYRGRVGVADDRFTAWVAAVTGTEPATAVARGGAAAFLAPRSLDLLPLTDAVRPLFRALGIKTIGEFAALPPPSVGRRLQQVGPSVQELARGDGPRFLRGFVPREPVSERTDLEHEIDQLEPLTFVVRPLADRICRRLRGRGTAAARVMAVLRGAGQESAIAIAPARPTLSSRTLLDLVRARLGERGLDHPVTSVELAVVDEGEAEAETLDLFGEQDGDRAAGEGVDVAIARLEAVFGEQRAGAAELVDSHRPEQSFRLRPFVAPRRPGRTAPRGGRPRDPGGRPRDPGDRARDPGGRPRRASACAALLPLAASGMVGALRLVDPPRPQPHAPAALELAGARLPVVAAHGPTRIEAEWWSADPVERDYYEVETADGGRYWLFRRTSDGRFYLHGIFD